MDSHTPSHPTGHVRVDRIQVVPEFNARDDANGDDLIPKIRRDGLLTPLTVRDVGGGWYELIAGHRRLDAVKKIGLVTVPVLVASDVVDAEFANWSENADRKDFTSYEEAMRFRRWHYERGMTCTEIAERLHRAIAYVSVRIQLTEDLHPDLIEKWRQNSSAPFFSEMRTLIRYPKNEQLREYNKVRSRRARIAAAKARKVAEGVVHVPVEDDGGNESNIRPRTLGLVNRRSASTCMTMINRHIPNSYLTPEEAKLAVGVVEWCLGMRHTLPFRVKRVRGDAKDERDFNQAHPVGSTPGDLGETVDDDAAE